MTRPAGSERPARRELMQAALVGAGGMLAVPQLAQGAEADAALPQKRGFRPPDAPSADASYTPAILASGGPLLFISGQGPADLQADMETQIRQTFDRIGSLLEAGGATWDDVVIIRSYWVHMLRDIELFRKVRRDYLREPYPASTAVGTPELAIPGLELEIEAVAVVGCGSALRQ